MNDRNDINPPDASHPPNGEPTSPQTSMDVLIGRIVDGEASATQRQRFESLAADDADLWRRLALRQQDMAMLAVHIEPALNSAERIELPLTGEGAGVVASAAPFATPVRAPWWLAVSGWAAVIALATLWGSGMWFGRGGPGTGTGMAQLPRYDPTITPADARTVGGTPEQHLQEYMQAPYVLGDMPPTLLNIDSLSDGRYAVSYLRRIVEIKYYDSASEIPLGPDGLTMSPRELRHRSDDIQSQPAPRD